MEHNKFSLRRKILAWRFLTERAKDITPLTIELIHIMIFHDWECGFKVSPRRDVTIESLKLWINRLFDYGHLLPSPVLFKMFVNIEPFYFGNEEIGRLILRWRDYQIKHQKRKL